jgi:hypothetical protein
MSKLLNFKPGDETWKKLRDRYTVSIPGKYSSLYMLNAELRELGTAIPMTYEAHWAMCLFAEGMTGIPEIDEARVKMILVPRGLGKSALVTGGLPLQKLLKHDDYAIGIANEKTENAERFLAAIKAEFEQNQLLRALWPERTPPDDATWKTNTIVINRKRPRPVSPSVLATGVGATVTGVHMDMWILDDIISQNAAENARAGSFSEIDATNRWLERLPPLLCAPKRDPILIIGTRWWVGDTYEWLEGDEDAPGLWGRGQKKQEFIWRVKLPPTEGRPPTTQNLKVYRRGEIAVFVRPAIENGHSIFPEMYTTEELVEMQEDNPVWFASQYLLAPSAGGASEFQEAWLKSYIVEEKAARFINEAGKIERVPFDLMTLLISVDPAFSKKRDSARTAIPMAGVWKNNVFLLEDFAERGMGTHDICAKVVDFCLRYGTPKKIFLETIVAQSALVAPMREALDNAGFSYIDIVEIPSHKGVAKGARIYGMENIFRTGHFFTRHDHTRFKDEYLAFPRGGTVDILDALAFQKSEWEKLAAHSGMMMNTQDNAYVQADLERLRKAFRR